MGDDEPGETSKRSITSSDTTLSIPLSSKQSTTTHKHAHTLQPVLTTAIPFTHIIEADHTSISHLATQTTNRNTPLPHRLTTLTTLLCRLVRHDISEELVMRPAFTTHLGSSGSSFATQDRLDHADLKSRLVALYQEATAAAEKHWTDAVETRFSQRLKALMVEMAGHMKEESGIMLPRLEGVLEPNVSLELGARYARTLVLTPDVRVGGRPYFEGVMEYVVADMDVFRGISERLERDTGNGVDGEYLGRRVEEELAGIGLYGGKEEGRRGGVEIVDAAPVSAVDRGKL